MCERVSGRMCERVSGRMCIARPLLAIYSRGSGINHICPSCRRQAISGVGAAHAWTTSCATRSGTEEAPSRACFCCVEATSARIFQIFILHQWLLIPYSYWHKQLNPSPSPLPIFTSSYSGKIKHECAATDGVLSTGRGRAAMASTDLRNNQLFLKVGQSLAVQL